MEENKQGYKQTDIGMIPEDWKLVTLAEISNYQGGSQPDISFFSSRKYSGYTRLIQIRDYKTDKYAVYIPESLARRKCTKNDIMIGRYGPPIFQILKGIEGAYNVALIKSIPNQTVDKSFFYYTLKREDLFQLIELLSRRSSGQTGVDLVGLKSFKIGLPQKNEQTAIATTLSNTDNLIAALDKKIAKKQQIKKGAMQQLLTGKKRLPGFNDKYKASELGQIPEDWNVVKVEETFRFLSTASFSRDELGSEGNVQCLHYGDIHTKYDEFIDFTHVELPKVIGRKGLNYPLLQDGDIIMADASEDYTGLCKSVELKNIGNKKVISGLHTILLREKNNTYENGFKGYIFKINGVRKQLIELSTGMKVFGVSKKNLGQIFVPVPTKHEQITIAQILTNMDNEIVRLEKERDKYKQLKTGMMQVLLTGKIRLIKN